MKRILHIALGEISTGELGIALSFVKGLDQKRYGSYFLIPDTKLRIIGKIEKERVMTVSRKAAPVRNRDIIMKCIQDNQFDAIFLFDAFTLEYAQEWTGINFDSLKELNIPIISLDEYEYTKAGYKIDYYGIFIKRLPALLERCDYVIKNCPLSMIEDSGRCLAQGPKKNEYYYRVFDKMDRISAREKEEIRNKYVYSRTEKRNAKIVFFTTSQWEVKGAYAFSCQNALASWLGVILHEYLKALDKDIVLVHVGTENWQLPSEVKGISYIHYDSLPVNIFEKVIQVADLFVTFNLVSITLSKAIIFGVPSLVLNNSKIIEFSHLKKKLLERPLWYQKMAREVKKIYPFTASMFGWGNFLKVVCTNNAYMNTFKRVDMFHYQKTRDMLRCMIFDEDIRQKQLEDNERFIEKYSQIKGADEIVDAIFHQLSNRDVR